jgi:hypothetical protein
MVSRLHATVGEVIAITPGFVGVTLRQEVAVSELFPEYNNNRDRYDWVIPSRKVIIECHGIQHYKLQTFGADAGVAKMNFETQKRRDRDKEEIARLNGWTYLIVPYTDEKKITPDYLHQLYSENLNQDTIEVKVQEQQPDPRHQEQLRKAREYRKQQYQKMKVIKNAGKRSRSRTTIESEEEA